MAEWMIAGQPAGALPEIGRIYEVRHSRKGVFDLKVLAVDGIWLTGLIVTGLAKAALAYNDRGAGEEITIRDQHAYLTPRGSD